MFCPNCGQDCGDAKFCTRCGTQLQQAVAQEPKKAAWTVGTPCPYCGGVGLNGNCCAFCGVQLVVGQPKGTENTANGIPCGFYDGVTSSLTLYEKECVVRTTILFFKKYEVRIPYDKITVVIYERSLSSSFSTGHLLFRWEGNKNVPIPKDNNFAGDPTTVVTSINRDVLFYHMYYMLKAIAPPTAEFRMVIPTVNIAGLDEVAAKTDLNAYFDQYAPYRDRAIEALCKRVGTMTEIARELINRVFDARQKEIYDADPYAAIRDLNLIVGKRNQDVEKSAKERQERIERNKRDALLYELEHRERD